MPVPRPEGHRRTARALCALAGGVVASAADKADAAAIEARWRGTRAQVRGARGWCSRAAARAVIEDGARGLVVCPAGYPCDPDPHRAALEAAPATRVVFAEPDAEAAMVAGALWGSDPRVAVIESAASDADGLMGAGQVRALPGPLCLLLPWVTGMLPPGRAAAMLARYGDLLPAGSALALTWWAPDGTTAGGEFLRAWGDAVAPSWGHSGQDVAEWLEAAGLEADGDGPQDVRVRPGGWRAEGAWRMNSPGRMMGAFARKPSVALGAGGVHQPGVGGARGVAEGGQAVGGLQVRVGGVVAEGGRVGPRLAPRGR
jgi:hypothetical protein